MILRLSSSINLRAFL
uniref:Uncharacterized protein n=1 Tax=Anguilla anguilla TaxID=7936 RepID=A0A0E9XWT5_ANGAN